MECRRIGKDKLGKSFRNPQPLRRNKGTWKDLTTKFNVRNPKSDTAGRKKGQRNQRGCRVGGGRRREKK